MYIRIWEKIVTLIAIPGYPDVLTIRKCSEVLFGPTLFYSVALRTGRESAVRDMLTEMHHEFHVSFVKITFKACQDILSVSTTRFSDNREMRVHFHGINKNIIVIYRVGLNSKLGHNDALSGWNEIAATSILFLNHWDQNKHRLWLPLWSEALVARGLAFYGGPPFLELSPFPYPTDPRFISFEVLEGKRKKGLFVSFLTGVGFQMVLEAIIGWEETLVCSSVLYLGP